MGSKGGSFLAPGFRFHPTDEELVAYYLKRKLLSRPMPTAAIPELDLYGLEPWELRERSPPRGADAQWYFFFRPDRKRAGGTRTNRATGQGYWKMTGKDREVRSDGRVVGMKKTLVFHAGRAPKGERTNWVMHEYRMADGVITAEGVDQKDKKETILDDDGMYLGVFVMLAVEFSGYSSDDNLKFLSARKIRDSPNVISLLECGEGWPWIGI